MIKKLNKFKWKRLVLLVFAILGIVMQAEAVTWKATMKVKVASGGGGKVYVTITESNVPSSGLDEDESNAEYSQLIGFGNHTFDFWAYAFPNTGYRFVRWALDENGTGSASTTEWKWHHQIIVGVGNHWTENYWAVFAANNYYAQMTAHASPSAGGTVLVAGGTAGATSTATNNTSASPGGSTVFTLTATPASGYYFAGWYKDSGFTQLDNSSASYNCTVTSSTSPDGTVTYDRYARFLQIPAVNNAYYLDLALGNVQINATTFSGYVHNQLDNSTYYYNNRSYTSSDKFYVYQSTPSNVASTGWNGSGVDVPSYSGVTTYNGGPVAMTGIVAQHARYVVEGKEGYVEQGWEPRATSVGRQATNHYIQITGSPSTPMTCNLTVDNLWSSYVDEGWDGSRTTGGISVNPTYSSAEGKNMNVTVTLKGDNRFQNIFYHSSSEANNNHLCFDGGSEGKGTMVVAAIREPDYTAFPGVGYPIRTDLGGARAGYNFYCSVIGGSDSNAMQEVYGLKFNKANVFAGCDYLDNCTPIGGGGNGKGQVEIVDSHIAAVGRTTGAAIGGGIGHRDRGGAAEVVISGGEVFAFNYGPEEFDFDIPVTAIGGGGSKESVCDSSWVTIKDGAFVYAYTVGGTGLGGGNSKEQSGGVSTILIEGDDANQTKVYAKVIDKIRADTITVKAGVGIGGGFSGEQYGGDCILTIKGNVYVATGTIGGGGSNSAERVGNAEVSIDKYESYKPEVYAQTQLKKSLSKHCVLNVKNATIGPRITDPYQPSYPFVYMQEDGRAVWIEDDEAKVNIENSTIYGCESRKGGAIYMVGGELNTTNSTIRNCTASSVGGAIYIEGGVATIGAGTKVLDNTATLDGGGVAVRNGSLSVASSSTAIEIKRNTVTDGSRYGGGIYAELSDPASSVLIDGNVVFEANQAYKGGGLYVQQGNTSVTNGVLFKSNVASRGGGVYTCAGLTFNNSTLDDNDADYGGGLFVDAQLTVDGATITNNTTNYDGAGIYVVQSLDIDNSHVNNNIAQNKGGGMYVGKASTVTSTEFKSNQARVGGGIYVMEPLTVESSTIDGNTTDSDGAGIYAVGNLTVKSTTIKNNESAAKGGGIFTNGSGTVSFSSSCSVIDNKAHYGAGVFVNDASSIFEMTGGNIKRNIASVSGGGVYAKGGVTIDGVLMEKNQAVGTDENDGKGGAFYVSGGTTTVRNATQILDNTARSGAGAYVMTSMSLSNSQFLRNIASGNGGAVFAQNGTTTLTGMEVNYNEADYGGAFFVNSAATINMASGDIQHNKANQSGGAIYSRGNVVFGGGNIQYNQATENGGAICVNSGSISVSGGNITNNTANALGGAIYSKGTFSMNNGTISSNAAQFGGGGLFIDGNSTTTITTGTISSNRAIDGGGIYIKKGSTLNLYASATITSNTCGDVTSGNGGGIYQGGTLNVAGTSLTVYNNYKTSPVKTDVQNNVFLVNEQVSNGESYTTSITVTNWTDPSTSTYYSGLQGTVNIGITVESVPHAVIHSETPDEPGHLVDLYEALRDHSAGSLLKDDQGKYQAIYSDGPTPYNLNDIFFIGTWQAYAFPEGVTEFKDSDRASDHDTYFGNINSEQRLAEFMCYVSGLNGYSPHPTQNGQVTNDLYMGRYVWLPIAVIDGNNTYSHGRPTPYSGHFDGGGHIISGLTSVGLMGINHYGLFGRTENATISNTFVTECLYRAYSGSSATPHDTIGGIVGKMVGGKMYYSEAGGSLFSTGTQTIMGGLVGYAQDAEIHSCMAMPSMECTGNSMMGGLVGKMYASYKNISGYTVGMKCRVYNCFANPMFVTESTTAYGGGLAGVMDVYGVDARSQVTECYVRLDREHDFDTVHNKIAALVGDMCRFDNTTSLNNVFLPEPGHCGVPGHSFVRKHRATDKGSISNYATYRAVSDPGTYYYDPAQDTRIDVVQQGIIPCPDEPQLLPQLLKQARDRNYTPTVADRPNPPICYWKRTGANSFYASGENINGDYPILDFDSVSPICGKTYAPAYIALGSKDGITLDYCVSLSAMLQRYNDYEGGGAINLFHSVDNSEGTYKATDSDVRLYLDEGVTILQGPGSYLNAVSYQTLQSGSVDYWHTFSSVMGPRTFGGVTKGESKIGFHYGIPGQVAFGVGNNPCNVSLDSISGDEVNSNNTLFPYNTPIDSLDLYAFYEPAYHWINFKRNSNSHWHMNGPEEQIEYENEDYLIPGKGYLVALFPAKKIYEYGILNCGNISTSSRTEDLITYTDLPAFLGYPGYNLLGNPYQAYLDLDKFAEANMGMWSGKRDLDTTFYMFDAAQNAYVGYKYETEPSEGSLLPSKWLAPHQGFFLVKSNKDDDAPTTARFIETGEGGMASLTGDGGLLRGENKACRLVNLTLTDEAGHADIASVEFGRPRFGGIVKQTSLRTGDAVISASYNDKDYTLLLLTKDVKTLPLHFECTEGGVYTLTWSTANGQFPRLLLVDNLTGVTTDCMEKESYTFEASPDDYKSRFKLVFHYDFEEDEDEEGNGNGGNANFVFINGGDFIINGEGYMQLIDMNGRVIVSTRLTDGQSRISIPEVAEGIYIVRLDEKSQKIVISK